MVKKLLGSPFNSEKFLQIPSWKLIERTNRRLLHLPNLLKIVSGKDCNLRLYPKLTDDESFVNCQTRNFIFTNQSWDSGNQTSPVCHIPEIIWTIYFKETFWIFLWKYVEFWTTVGTVKTQQSEKTDTEKVESPNTDLLLRDSFLITRNYTQSNCLTS